MLFCTIDIRGNGCIGFISQPEQHIIRYRYAVLIVDPEQGPDYLFTGIILDIKAIITQLILQQSIIIVEKRARGLIADLYSDLQLFVFTLLCCGTGISITHQSYKSIHLYDIVIVLTEYRRRFNDRFHRLIIRLCKEKIQEQAYNKSQ